MITTLWTIFLVTFFIASAHSGPGMSESGTAVKQILDDIFQQYDKGIRPNYGERATQIGVTAYVLEFYSLDITKMEFTLSFYFRQSWNDPRVAFNTQQYSSRGSGGNSRGRGLPDEIVLDENRSSKLWRPDTFFVNERSGNIHLLTKSNEFTRIKSNGSVLTSSRYTMTASCPMDLRYFPFDTQICVVEIESFAATMNDISYYWGKGVDSLGVSASVSLPELRVKGHSIKSHEISLSHGNYSRLTMSFEFERSMGYHILQSYFPIAIIVTISLLTLLFANPFLEPLIHVIAICMLISHCESWMKTMPKISYLNALYLYFFICLAHLILSLIVSLGAALRYLRQNQNSDSLVCSICKPLTELDNYRRTNSRRVQSNSKSCSPGSVFCYFIKLVVIGLFVASNVLYVLYYRSALIATNQKISDVTN